MSKYSLANLVREIKSDHKATKSASATLQQMIDTYLLSGEFNSYLSHHRHDLAKYIGDADEVSDERFRASQAGSCPQRQAYAALNKELGTEAVVEDRPVTQMQALFNGTFMHIRFHMLFDAMTAKGMMETLSAEELKVSPKYSLSGHIDRAIRFEFGGMDLSVIVDFKSIKSYYFQSLVKAKDDHKAQQHAYRLLGFNADEWMMIYECKDTHIRKVYSMPYDDDELERLRALYVAMNRWVDEAIKGVPAMQRIVLPLERTWCSNCPYKVTCDAEHVV